MTPGQVSSQLGEGYKMEGGDWKHAIEISLDGCEQHGGINTKV